MLRIFETGRDKVEAALLNQSKMQLVRGYWEALRQDRAIPTRAEIDARGMANALENVFLIERIAPGQARFRLAGTHLSELMGMDVRGMPVSSLIEPNSRARFSELLEASYDVPTVLDLRLEAERSLSRPALSAHLCILPLATIPGEPQIALGCLVSAGNIGRGSRRFAIASVVQEVVRTESITNELGRGPADSMRIPDSVSKTGSHLRLVHSR